MCSGVFATKTCEFIVTIVSDVAMDFPELRLAAFNPLSKRYETLSTDPIRMEPIQRPPEMDQKEVLDFGEVERRPGEALDLEKSAVFWSLQGLLAAFWLALVGRGLVRRHAAARARDPWYQLKGRWKRLLEAPSADAEAWLTEAERLLFDTVQARTRLPFSTRREAVAFARRTFGREAAESLDKLFRTWENSRFSPQKPPVPLPGEWIPSLKALKPTLLRKAKPRAGKREPA
jgi:hypothetical protein